MDKKTIRLGFICAVACGVTAGVAYVVKQVLDGCVFTVCHLADKVIESGD